tara:strand:- start:161 stop:379 length:219 start_codon:yes stop_codon:yes gene_type:complete
VFRGKIVQGDNGRGRGKDDEKPAQKKENKAGFKNFQGAKQQENYAKHWDQKVPGHQTGDNRYIGVDIEVHRK